MRSSYLLLFALPIVALSGCSTKDVVGNDGCSKDYDCEGGLICEGGKCVEQQSATSTSSSENVASDAVDTNEHTGEPITATTDRDGSIEAGASDDHDIPDSDTGEPIPADGFIDAGLGEEEAGTGNNQEPRPSSEGVNDTCMPEVIPAGGFDRSDVYLEETTDCLTGLCAVFYLEGDPSKVDQDGGPAREDIEDAVYCTCRCAAPDDTAVLCECPEGFECKPLFDIGPSTIRGSYCVKKR